MSKENDEDIEVIQFNTVINPALASYLTKKGYRLKKVGKGSIIN